MQHPKNTSQILRIAFGAGQQQKQRLNHSPSPASAKKISRRKATSKEQRRSNPELVSIFFTLTIIYIQHNIFIGLCFENNLI